MQIELSKEVRFITAFSALNHHYEFRMLPFGLQSSGIAWLYTIHRILQKFIPYNVYIYVDDICLWSSDEDKHIQVIKNVLKQLIKYHIKLKPQKCKFLQKQIKYLGYKISSNGLEIDETKTVCIRNWPVPTNLKKLQRFVGFANFYRKYIQNFSQIALPLYKLCKRDVPYIWTPEAQLAFDTLREKLLNPPVLAYPNFDLPSVVISDASNYAAGGILANKDGKDERPIQYFRRSFNQAQSRYSVVHKELIAAIWCISWFRSFLVGRTFYLVVDQKSLLYLIKRNYKDTIVHRWAIELMEYDFEIIHGEGTKNAADALSRIQIDDENDKLNVKVMCRVTTRSKSKEQIEKQNAEANKNEQIGGNIVKKPNTQINERFFIEEKRSFIYESTNYDHISYFFSHINCKLHKQLQNKMKKQIEIKNLDYGEIFTFDQDKSIILIPSLLRSNAYIINTEKSLKTFALFIVQKGFEKVAINIDIRDNVSYLELKKLIRKWFATANTHLTMYLNTIIYVTDPLEIKRILLDFHISVQTGAHAGWNRMYANLKKYYSFQNTISIIKSFVTNCEQCQKNKVTKHTKQPLQISDSPSTSFQHIAIDHVGRLIPSTQNNAYILTIICTLTKYAIAIAVPDVGADTTARNLVEKVFLIYGYPEKITSDNHQTFNSELIKQICKYLKINQVFTSPFHAASNTVERVHSTFGSMIRCYVNEQPELWETKLPFVVSAYNCSINTATNISPFELIFAKPMALPFSVTNQRIPRYTFDDYIHEMREYLHYA